VGKNRCEVGRSPANAADASATIELTQALVDGILCKAAVDGDADRLRSAAPEKWTRMRDELSNSCG
jgi:hypothetical protein